MFPEILRKEENYFGLILCTTAIYRSFTLSKLEAIVAMIKWKRAKGLCFFLKQSRHVGVPIFAADKKFMKF